MEYNGLTPDVYISPSGDDSTGDGSVGSPYATTTKAIAETSAGDVIGFIDGTYPFVYGDFDMNDNRTFVGQSFGGVVIDCGAVSSLSAQYFLRFGVNDTRVDVINIWIKDMQVIVSGGRSALNIENNGTSEAVVFTKCIISNCMYPTGVSRYGLFSSHITNTNIRMEMHGCLMWNIAGDKSTAYSQVFRTQGFGDYFKLINNTFVFNDVGWGGFLPQHMFYLPDNEEIYLRNNIWANYGTGQIGFIWSEGASGSMDADFELFYGENSAWNDLPSTGTPLTSDPKLIDPEFSTLTDPSQALALQTNSPCLGTGTGAI